MTSRRLLSIYSQALTSLNVGYSKAVKDIYDKLIYFIKTLEKNKSIFEKYHLIKEYNKLYMDLNGIVTEYVKMLDMYKKIVEDVSSFGMVFRVHPESVKNMLKKYESRFDAYMNELYNWYIRNPSLYYGFVNVCNDIMRIFEREYKITDEEDRRLITDMLHDMEVIVRGVMTSAIDLYEVFLYYLARLRRVCKYGW